MLGILLLIGVTAAATGAPADTAGDGARRLVREARIAVEGDSAPAVMARWSARLAPDSTDRAALLGLATAARLSYDDPAATRLYRRLLPSPRSSADAYADYARLGLARLAFDRTDDAGVRLAGAGGARRCARAPRPRRRRRGAPGRGRREDGRGRAAGNGLSRQRTPGAAGRRDGAARGGAAAGVSASPSGAARRFARASSPRRWGMRGGSGRAGRRRSACAPPAIDFWTRGLEDSAVVLLRQSAELQRAARDRRSLAFTLTTLADLYRDRGAYGESRAAANESLAQARASHYVSGEALATQMLGTLAYSLRDIPTAARQLDRAYALYGTLNDSADQMNVRSWQANIARDEGDLAGARRLDARGDRRGPSRARRAVDDRSVPGARRHRDPRWRLAGRRGRARHRRAGCSAAHGIETWAPQAGLSARPPRAAPRRPRLGRADLPAATSAAWGRRRAASARGRVPTSPRSCARRGDLAAPSEELTAAGDALDAWRAGRSVTRQLRLLRLPGDRDRRERRNASVPRVLAALAARRPGRGGVRAGRTAPRARARRPAARGVGARRSFAGRPGDASSARAATGAVTRATTAAGIAGLLPDDRTALVEYVTGAFGAPTTAFVVTRRGGPPARVHPPAGRFARRADRAIRRAGREGRGRRRGTRAPSGALSSTRSSRLGPEVVRLVIVPDGPLHRVPWDALRLADGRWLVERYAVGLAPSAGALAVLWQRSRTAAPADSLRLLAMGDPDFGRLAAADTELFAAAGGLPPLPARAPRRGSSPATRRTPSCGSAPTPAPPSCATPRSPGSR